MSGLEYNPTPSVVPYFLSDKFVNLIMGPVGSSKTTASLMKLVYEAQRVAPCKDGVRRSRIAIIRNTSQMLDDSTIPDFMKLFGEAGEFMKTSKRFMLRFNDVEAEVLFRGLDDSAAARRLLSTQLSFGIIDEFREIHPEIFNALTGRLGRYPDKTMNGVGCCDDSGKQIHKVWAASNPPDQDSWWETYLSEPPENAAVFFQPSGVSDGADWRKFLPDGYYENLMQGKSDDWIEINVHGRFGASLSGKAVFRSFNQDYHVAKEPLKPIISENHPLIIGLDFGLCYDDTTEVLTDSGWKLFKDVDEKIDLAATMNPDTREVEYTRINFKVAKPYSGDMLEWKNSTIDFCVTPEHRTPHTYRDSPDTIRWASAEELSQQMSSHRYITVGGAEWKGQMPSQLPVGMTPYEYAEFMGWYLSDGSCDYTGETSRVTISQKKQAPSLMSVSASLLRCGVTPHYTEGKGLRFSNKELAEHVLVFGRKHKGKRRVPKILLDAPPDVIRVFVSAYTAGDGHIRTRKNGSLEHTIAFNNPYTASDFQELGMKLGITTSLRVQSASGSSHKFKDGRETISSSDMWVVAFKYGTKRAELLPEAFRRFHYDGMIYCLNVPYHTLYVRRGGRPCWNGNTPACTINQQDARGRFLTFRSLVSDGMGILRFCREKLKPMLSNEFPGHPVIVIGDPAGVQRAQTDERSAFDILKSEGFTAIPAKTNVITARISAVENLLSRQIDGEAAWLIDPGAIELIRAMRGGYRYKVKTNGETEDKPEKNAHSHVSDAHQYAALHVDSVFGAPVRKSAKREIVRVSSFGWT